MGDNLRAKQMKSDDNPFPVRLGYLKRLLQTEAMELDTNISLLIKMILNEHYDKGEMLRDKSEQLLEGINKLIALLEKDLGS